MKDKRKKNYFCFEFFPEYELNGFVCTYPSYRAIAFYYGKTDLQVYPVRQENNSYFLFPYPGRKLKQSRPDPDFKVIKDDFRKIGIKIGDRIKFKNLDELPGISRTGLKNSWDLFYNQATLSDITMALRRDCDENKRQKQIINLNNYISKGYLDDLYKPNNYGNEEKEIKIYKRMYESLINLIKLNPQYIKTESVNDLFIALLYDFQSPDDCLRKMVKEVLINELIGKSKGGKKPFRKNIGGELAIDLTKKLVKYLSGKLKEAFDLSEDKKQGLSPDKHEEIKNNFGNFINKLQELKRSCNFPNPTEEDLHLINCLFMAKIKDVTQLTNLTNYYEGSNNFLKKVHDIPFSSKESLNKFIFRPEIYAKSYLVDQFSTSIGKLKTL